MINEDIIAYRDLIVRQCKDNPPLLNHLANNDNATADDYAGREILELLQNAADAGDRIKLELKDNVLTISNNGIPFSLDGIKALMMPDNSTKSDDYNLMGCKGVGFRAVLNISDDILVSSGNINIRFNKETASRIKEEAKLDKVLSVLACPEIVATTHYSDKSFITNVSIKIRDNSQLERITAQLEAIDKETILFLKGNSKRLEVLINGKKTIFERTKELLSANESLVTLKHNDNSVQLREFFEEGILEDEENIKNRHYRLAAIYSSEPILNNKLFASFHTDIDFPMKHWFAHGDFSLTNNRNQLVKNKRNRFLFERLLQLICNSATKLSKQIDYTGYIALKSHGSFSSSILDNFDANELLDTIIRKTRLLPTTSGHYISIDSDPVFYANNLQQFLLDMPNNSNLLQYADNQDIVNYLNNDTDYYSIEQISDFLNAKKNKLTNNERVLCAKLVWDCYKHYDDFQAKIPDFFVDENGKDIENGSIVIREPKLSEMTLPAFLEQRYLCSEQLDSIKSLLNVSSDENLVSTFFAETFGIEIANIDKLLDKLDSLVKDCPSKMPEYTRWLFDNRKAINKSRHENFYLLAKDGTIKKSNCLYFGNDYINDTQLERFFEDSKIIAKPAVLGISNNEVPAFSEFFKTELKVNDYPLSKDGSIDGLESILELADTEYILNLLFRKKDYLNSFANTNTKELFRNRKWVQKNNRRYAPKDIIIVPAKNIYRKISDHMVADFIILSKDDFLSGIKVEEFESTWLIKTFLAIKSEINQLDYEYLYDILNKLPSFDRKGRISGNIYKDIIETKNRDYPNSNCVEFNKFRKDGKVFCKDGNYHNINDCLYLEKSYPKAVSADHNYIDIAKTKDIETIQRRLGINSLSIDYRLEDYKESPLSNKDYENELINLKAFLLVTNGDFFDNEEKINNLRDITIVLCENISITFSDTTGELGNYEYIEKDNIFYIKVPTIKLLSIKGNRNYQNTISDIIKTIFKSQQISAGEIARAASFSLDARADIIKEDFSNTEWQEAFEKIAPIIVEGNDYSEKNLNDLYELKDEYSGEYARRLYSIRYNSSDEDKKALLDEIEKYNNYSFDPEDIPSDQDANLLDYLFSIFPILSEEMVFCGDMEKTFKESFDRIISEFPNNREEVNTILNNQKLKSLLYFGALSEVRDAIRNQIERAERYRLQQEKLENLAKASRENTSGISFSTADIFSSKLDKNSECAPTQNSKESSDDAFSNEPFSGRFHNDRNITIGCSKPASLSSTEEDSFNEDALENLLTDGATKKSFEDIPSQKTTNNSTKSTRIISSQERKDNEAKRERRAKISEQYALKEYEKEGYETEWVSAYARDEGMNPNGGDGYGYDIIARKDGEVRYIEVKSTTATTGIEFTMTRNEFEQCRKHRDNYDIAYVFSAKNIDNNMKPDILILSNVFYRINASNTTPESCKIRLK